MRTIAFAVCVTLLSGFAAPEVARDWADRSAERAVAAAIGHVPGLRAGRVRSQGGARSIEIDDAAFAGRGWTLTAGRLVLPGKGLPVPSLVTAAEARSAAVSADDVSLTFGGTKVVVPHLEARGTELTSEGLATLLDPADPATLAQRLAKLTAASFSAPEVHVAAAGADITTEQHLVIKAVSLTDVSAGRIGALAIGSAGIHSPLEAANTTVPFETGPIAIDGIDLPLALEMATGSRTETATALRPLFRSLSIAAIAVHPDNETSVEIEAISMGALRGRPLLLPPSDVMSLLDKDAMDRTAADRQVLADLIGDAVASAALDHLDVRGVAATEAGDEHGSLKLARGALDGFEIDKLGTLSLTDAAFQASGATFAVGRFVVGGYDASGIVDIVRRQVAGIPDAPSSQLVPNRFSMAMTDLHLAIPARPPGMGAVDPSKSIVVDVPVASIGTGAAAGTGSIASQAVIELAYDVSAAASDPSFRNLVQLGLSRLDLGADYLGTFDPTSKEVRLDRLVVDAEGLGRVSLRATLGNASAALFHPDRGGNTAAEAVQKLVFQSLDFGLVNAGIVERVLPPLAAAAKVSVPLFKAQMKAQAEISISQMFGPTPASARIIEAVRTFIDTPKTLRVTVKAPSGLPLSTLASATDPKALLGGLDIQVVANR